MLTNTRANSHSLSLYLLGVSALNRAYDLLPFKTAGDDDAVDR